MFKPTKKQLYRQTEKIADALIAEQQYNDRLLSELICLEKKYFDEQRKNIELQYQIRELQEEAERTKAIYE